MLKRSGCNALSAQWSMAKSYVFTSEQLLRPSSLLLSKRLQGSHVPPIGPGWAPVSLGGY